MAATDDVLRRGDQDFGLIHLLLMTWLQSKTPFMTGLALGMKLIASSAATTGSRS